MTRVVKRRILFRCAAVALVLFAHWGIVSIPAIDADTFDQSRSCGGRSRGDTGTIAIQALLIYPLMSAASTLHVSMSLRRSVNLEPCGRLARFSTASARRWSPAPSTHESGGESHLSG